MAEKTVKVKITSAVVIDGAIVGKGKSVTIGEALAKDLLRREKCEFADGTKAPAKAKAGKKGVPQDLLDEAKELEIKDFEKMNEAELIAAVDAATKG